MVGSWYFPESIGYEPLIVGSIAECGVAMQDNPDIVTAMEYPTVAAFLKSDDWAQSQSVKLEVSPSLAFIPVGLVYPKGSTLRDVSRTPHPLFVLWCSRSAQPVSSVAASSLATVA
jgi:hypothetical protein